MGLNFTYATASEIIFGIGSFNKIGDRVAGKYKNALVVCGRKTGYAEKLLNDLSVQNIKGNIFNILTEPTIDVIQQGIELGRKTSCDVVLGIGGGSAVDSAKAIAAMIPNEGTLSDYLEVIGKGKPLTQDPVPCIAIPTTSGTGAEVTKNSVIKSVDQKVKVSLRSEKMYPNLAVVDPQLTQSMPPNITASTGIDALTHLMETFISNQSNPFIDMFCREGMKRVACSLGKAYLNGSDLEAREDMAMASMLGGMALANVKLGAVHGFAGPMGGMFEIPHGAVCACLLPAVMEVNNMALEETNGHRILMKYQEVAQILTGDINAGIEQGIEYVKKLVEKLEIQSLSEFGITVNNFSELIEKAKRSSSMKGNPVELTDDQLIFILERSM